MGTDEGMAPEGAEHTPLGGTHAVYSGERWVAPTGCSQRTGIERAKRKRYHDNVLSKRRVSSQKLQWTDVARQRYIDAHDQFGLGEGGGVT